MYSNKRFLAQTYLAGSKLKLLSSFGVAVTNSLQWRSGNVNLPTNCARKSVSDQSFRRRTCIPLLALNAKIPSSILGFGNKVHFLSFLLVGPGGLCFCQS